MKTPNWFWGVVALCLLALTAGLLARLRYQPLAEAGPVVFRDTWTGRICGGTDLTRYICTEGP